MGLIFYDLYYFERLVGIEPECQTDGKVWLYNLLALRCKIVHESNRRLYQRTLVLMQIS